MNQLPGTASTKARPVFSTALVYGGPGQRGWQSAPAAILMVDVDDNRLQVAEWALKVILSA